MRIILLLLPVLAVIGVLAFRGRRGVRFAAVALVLFAVWPVAGSLIAPHRVAEELVHRSPQSEEWRRGARDTRDAVYQVLPTLVSAFITLAALALIPAPKK
jgi:phosphate/sulfate permease